MAADAVDAVDYVINGGGLASSLLPNRLTEDCVTTLCMLPHFRLE